MRTKDCVPPPPPLASCRPPAGHKLPLHHRCRPPAGTPPPPTSFNEMMVQVEYTGVEDFRGRSDIRRARVARNVTTIAKRTFEGCNKLMEVDLGNVTMLEFGAFRNCKLLTHILIPSTLTEIGGHAFAGCKMLEDVELPEGLRKIGYNSFSACTSLRHINFPSSLISS